MSILDQMFDRLIIEIKRTKQMTRVQEDDFRRTFRTKIANLDKPSTYSKEHLEACDAVILVKDVRKRHLHDPIKNTHQYEYADKDIHHECMVYDGQQNKPEFDPLLEQLRDDEYKNTYVVKKSGDTLLGVYHVVGYGEYTPRNGDKPPNIVLMMKELDITHLRTLHPKAEYLQCKFLYNLGIESFYKSTKRTGIQLVYVRTPECRALLNM